MKPGLTPCFSTDTSCRQQTEDQHTDVSQTSLGSKMQQSTPCVSMEHVLHTANSRE
jgi:hypothetical protein